MSAPDRNTTPAGSGSLGPVERRRITVPGSGVEIALLDWGGGGPLALLHHANGFCGALWAPVAEALRERFRVVAVDARGHGDSSLPPEGAVVEAFAWPSMADDLAFVARRLVGEAARPAVALGIGHSFGGTLTLAAAARHPGLFDRALLVDPVILPKMTPEQDAKRMGEIGLAVRARRRRHVWADRREAREYLAERGLFAAWQPRVLDLYVEEGLRERADGRVELKCSGAVEACVFENGHTLDTFGCAAGLGLPVDLLWASGGDFPRAIYDQLAGVMGDTRVREIDAGHLVPMERPDLVIEAVDRLYDR